MSVLNIEKQSHSSDSGIHSSYNVIFYLIIIENVYIVLIAFIQLYQFLKNL